MKRGLGMWIMSKLVLLIFLLSLVFVMGIFFKIYSEKSVTDTARSYTVVWSEIGGSTLLYTNSLDSIYLDDRIEVERSAMDYTGVVEKVREDKLWRVVFFLAWKDHESVEEIQEGDGFAAASVTNLNPEITVVHLFQGQADTPTFVEVDDLVFHPSVKDDRDTNLVFYRNGTVFCVGSVKGEYRLSDSITNLGKCCVEKPTDIECKGALPR